MVSDTPDRSPLGPHMGGLTGVPRGPPGGHKLSRLGELLNTQKNVHFFAPGGWAPRGPPGGSPQTPPE